MLASVAGVAGQQAPVREISRVGIKEWYVTRAGATAADLRPLAERMKLELGADVVGAQCFGPRLGEVGQRAAAELLAASVAPLTWVQGCSTGPGLGGLHVQAVAGVEVEPLRLAGRLVGVKLTGPHALECRLAGLYAGDTAVPRDRQARATFELMERALALAGMDFSHVARTWLYLDDILSWYGEFNRVRNEFFTEQGVFDRVVPASTGIGGSNPAGAAVMAGAYAVKPLDSEVTMQAIPSPLQCPALQYGSSFSRAVEVVMPGVRRLLVSGTASIAPDGLTQHVDDVAAQTVRTFEVVGAILQSRDMGWEDVTRAIAYVRHATDAGVVERYRQRADVPALPVIVAHNVICRDDLLFELELDAVRAR